MEDVSAVFLLTDVDEDYFLLSKYWRGFCLPEI